MHWLAASLALVLTLPVSAAAQPTRSALMEVVLRDGTTFVGEVVSDDASTVVLRGADGAEVSIARERIKRMSAFTGHVVDGEYWRDDALASKLFLSATGRSLRRGQAYIGIYQILVPVLHIGITDRLSVGLGKPFYVFSRDIWITPKFQVRRGARTSAAVGLMHFHIAHAGDVQAAYGAGTIDGSDSALTLGGGWFRARRDEDHPATRDAGLLIVGVERRTGRRAKLISENYIYEGGATVSLGVRLIGRIFHFEAGGVFGLAPGTKVGGGPFFSLVWAGQ